MTTCSRNCEIPKGVISAGARNDFYQIEVKFEEIIRTVTSAGISIDGLFINVDAGFDSNELRRVCGAKGMQVNIS